MTIQIKLDGSKSTLKGEWISLGDFDFKTKYYPVFVPPHLEGTSYDLPDGYIIVRGVEGEFYPCEPNIFEKTYDIKGVI